MILTDDSLLEVNPSAVFATIENEAVILDINTGVYYGLNEVAMRVWQLAKERESFGRISAVLRGEFDVDASVLDRDLRSLIETLERLGLVRLLTA